MNNISQILKENCYGCELCSMVCNKDAIKMIEDDEGFLYPVLDADKCENCGLCLKKCPSNIDNVFALKHNKNVYALSLSDSDSLIMSSSGGAAFSIMQYAINNNINVVGVEYDKDYNGCHYSIGRTIDEIDCFRGTKYIQARKKDIFIQVKTLLEKKEKVIFFGLPCDVAACRIFLQEKYDDILYVELICHGATSPKVAKQYLDSMRLKYGEITYMTIREKKYGWTPGCMRIIFDNGKNISTLFDSTEYGYAFRNMSRPKCYNCLYKGDNRKADITIGDYWGITAGDDCWNVDGVSVVFTHNEKADEVIRKLKNINLTEISYEKGIRNNSCINNSRNIGVRNRYSKFFCEKDIFYARKKTEKFKDRVLRITRNNYYKLLKRKHRIKRL